MHPHTAFRSDDRALHEALIEQIGFGTIFAHTPDGPRVAHTPLWSTGDGALQFHLARGNALTRHVAGHDALAVVNGPEAYVSPRWYADTAQVPTWNYVALELEGPVRQMDPEGLTGFLDTLSAREEARIEGPAWTRDKMGADDFARMLGGIVGFEMEIKAWRPTFKLSQNKPDADRQGVIEALEQRGSRALASLMRELA
ncbi:FMN-binding negative transcriptional regulator [Croceicoccus ponticola]|uniref:FMN-binding negative transcriptional regulator n=1 Tax=Croceicoccus ponticola TaxID=2217664 RepID=A0A437GWL0_9SPHN|nr:FMN-binding negative transcriptional regulator [Croceicoccus ponticola]RVQ66479.1 FMN-binding negative transcriptional regulator [Croceicoccus ponticola]